MPEGTALYVRRISKRHGSPYELASRFKEGGCKWVAIGGPWHEKRSGKMVTKLINSADTCRKYSDAMAKVGITPWIWGYPWQGTETKFAQQMRECAGDHKRILLDPELGSNPTRSKEGTGKAAADEHALRLVEAIYAAGMKECGLSTFGSGWRMKWFPLLAFTKALLDCYRTKTFIGGQTYTDDGLVDRSIADMITVIKKADPNVAIANNTKRSDSIMRPFVTHNADIEVVPNFGSYAWVARDKSKKMSRSNRKAVSKTPAEFIHHLSEFIDDGEPVGAMIGWAENFMNAKLWAELAKFSDWLERGACRA